MRVHWGVVIFFCCGQLCAFAQILRPQIANPEFATNNPTLTTVALEKPFCAFDGSMSKGASYEVHLYVVVDSGDVSTFQRSSMLPGSAPHPLPAAARDLATPKPATTSSASVMDNSSKPLSATFQETNGGQRGPYKAAIFNVPHCASPPKLSDTADIAKAPAVLTQYLIRVGDDTACLYNPYLQEVCNPPLSEDTSYRFKFVLVDQIADIVKDQTLWSNPIKTNKLKPSSSIDTWPGQRSGGMIVITFVLSVLMFVIAAAFLAMLASREISTAVRYQPQTTQCADLNVQEMSASDH